MVPMSDLVSSANGLRCLFADTCFLSSFCTSSEKHLSRSSDEIWPWSGLNGLQVLFRSVAIDDFSGTGDGNLFPFSVLAAISLQSISASDTSSGGHHIKLVMSIFPNNTLGRFSTLEICAFLKRFVNAILIKGHW